jgi:aspartyl-tRNA(Asn)/glutamyl-tRNA(Gln) amidotransferase subunit A
MTAGSLADLDVAALRDRYATGSATPSAVLDAVLARIDAVDGELGACCHVAADTARRAAEASDRRWHEGTARPLEGVPFGVKDIVDTAGIPTTGGTLRWRDHVPACDATVIRRLLDAGAVLVAKLATPELAFGDARPGHTPTNPWSAEHWTGGSSSGPAVALAGRELPLAVGTDTGGSIRVPASYCGVTGLKPTFGRVQRGGVWPVSWTLDHTGPMARTVADVALALSVVAGEDPGDPASRPVPLDDYVGATTATDLAGVRVGRPIDWFGECDDDVATAVDAAVAVLVDLGATTVDVPLPSAHLAGTIAWTITVAEFASLHEDHLDDLDGYTPAAAARLVAGATLPASDYLRALRLRHVFQRELDEAFARCDVLVTPGTPTTAPRLAPTLDPIFAGGDVAWLERIARTLIPWNAAGVPALVLPCGLAGGLPVGLQVVGPPWHEAAVLRVGAAFQAATAHHRVVPPSRVVGPLTTSADGLMVCPSVQ